VFFSVVPSFGRRIIMVPPITLPLTIPILNITPRLHTLNRATHRRRRRQHSSQSRIGGTTALLRTCITPM
jgi:hypothetical protein